MVQRADGPGLQARMGSEIASVLDTDTTDDYVLVDIKPRLPDGPG